MFFGAFTVVGFWLALILLAIATVTGLVPAPFAFASAGLFFVPLVSVRRLVPLPVAMANCPPLSSLP
jgi:hypothetical protein